MKNINKKDKAILFFSFYFVFFLILILVINSNRKIFDEKDKEIKENLQEEVEVTGNNLYFYDILHINYQYDYEIDIDGEIINYHGTKDNIDYADSEYKYFFDVYNLNQLIKKSKVIEKVDNYGKYLLNNEDLGELLESESTGKTIIEVFEKEELEIHLDLHEYYGKNVFKIKLVYKEGEKND